TRLEIDSTPRASGDHDQRGGVIARSPGAIIFDGVKAEPGQPYGPLPSDAADVKLVHEMLLRFGYERRDIRILCDVCGGFNGRADPTRENILQSLEWLVAGATAGDRRFLHFSGHGDRILGDLVNGKRARRVEPRLNMPGAWNIDTERSSTRVFSRRATEQVVEEDELVYYNEGIITRLSEVRDELTDGEYTDKILDSELNEYLSKLPEGCTITSIMDCCASGRILNLSHKLLGGGFRGQHDTAIAQNRPGFFQNTPVENTKNSSGEAISPSPSVASVAESAAPSISTVVCIMMKVVPRLMRYAREVMQEGIPDRERDLDNIKARIVSEFLISFAYWAKMLKFAWGACHQRQESWETNDRSAGLFTQTFTETCLRLAGPSGTPNQFTYNQLFNEVSQQVAEKRAGSCAGWGNSKPAPQFVQLWTSLKNAGRAAEINLLDSPVLF
ncbi:unnamed protein product, partial [Rhizoctonia solani]